MKKRTIVVSNPLKSFPSCPHLENGRCSFLGMDASLRICSLCEQAGPFCGKILPKDESDYFAWTVKKVLGASILDITAINKSLPTNKKAPEPPPSKKNWAKVKPSWEKAHSLFTSTSSRGIFSTILDVLNINKVSGERVSSDIYEKRRLSCFGNGKSIQQCQMLKRDASNSPYCGACGCGVNKLAILESEGYHKLYYPYLECPMEKLGFSNERKNILSVIITALNENPDRLNNTIKTLRDGAYGYDLDIIVVDDCSDVPVTVLDEKTRLFRNKSRIGCAPSRHFGAAEAYGKYILFTDGHMIYKEGWFSAFLGYAEGLADNVALCGVCVGLDDDHTTLENSCGNYNGAKLELFDEPENQILEGKWISDKDEDFYKLSCMMGAVYFINKDYFFKLLGLSELKMWGSDEPCLALKILRSGGEMRMCKKILAGHFFRQSTPYVTGNHYLLYNKIFMAKTLLPNDLSETLLNKIPKDGNFEAAMKLIELNVLVIDSQKKHYESIFTKSIEQICLEYEIKKPL